MVSGRRLLAVCFGQFPYNLPLHVAVAVAAVARCFHCFSARFSFFLGKFAHGETVETHYTNAELRSQTTYGFN